MTVRLVTSGFVATATLGAVLMACGSHEPRSEATSPPDSTTEVQPSPSQRLPAEFGFARVQSFAEAEARAGFHVPDSAQYQLMYDTIYLQPDQPTEQFPRPAVDTIYRLPSGAFVQFGIAPAYYWSANALETGQKRVLGGRDGWLVENRDDYLEFAYKCGSGDDSDLWCTVSSNGIAIEDLGRVVATFS